jgi:LssY C-terminus
LVVGAIPRVYARKPGINIEPREREVSHFPRDRVVETESDVAMPLRRSRSMQLVQLIIGLLLAWLVIAYFLLPTGWKWYARRHPTFDDSPRITVTSDRHPGDPLNVALIGTEAQLKNAMRAAKWDLADRLSLKSDLKIAADTVLSRPDPEAPVSSLFLFGRKEDLAFEQPVGNNPRHRHHVRFWKTDNLDNDGRPQWIGSAVYDKHVGLSRTTGQITHVTDSDVDAERDYLFQCLEGAGQLAEQYVVHGFHTNLEGRNGGGDRWRTDGDLYVGVLVSAP